MSADEPPLIPGLELVSSPAALTQMARAASKTTKVEADNQRLRDLLQQALHELEALRARLG